MNKGLSKREKNMLLFLAIFILVLASLYGMIFPAFETRNNLLAMQAEKETQKMEMELAIQNLPNSETQLQQSLVALDDAKKDYTPALQNEDIDTMLTAILKKSGLKIDTLTINNLEPILTEEQPAAAETPVEQSESAPVPAEPPAPAGQVNYYEQAEVECIVLGSRAAFINLVGAIGATSGLQIESFSTGSEGDAYKVTILVNMQHEAASE